MPFQQQDNIGNLLGGPAWVFYTPDVSTLALQAPAAPTLATAATGGTVAAGTYTIAVTYVNAFGETLASATATITTTGSSSTVTITGPPTANVGLAGVATGWYAYVSQAGGTSLTRQQAPGSPTAIGTSLTITAPPTSTGAPAPTTAAGAWNTSGAIPTKLDDIVTLTTPYTLKAPWVFGGALERSNVTLARSLAMNAITTAHTNIPVSQRVTGTTRTLTIPFQEVSPAIRALIENQATVETVAQGIASSGTPAQSRVRFGAVQQIIRHRIAVLAERNPGDTQITTEGGNRGQLFGHVILNAGIGATASNLDLNPDNVVAQSVQFDAYPEPSAPDIRMTHGFSVFETGISIP